MRFKFYVRYTICEANDCEKTERLQQTERQQQQQHFLVKAPVFVCLVSLSIIKAVKMT